MAYSPNSLTTGTLGYSLRKEFLNDGLFYRETENYSYLVYALPNIASATGYTDIENLIKTAFAGYSGDLTIKNLSESADFVFPDDHVRVGKFQVDIENRKAIVNLATYQPELNGNYYKGLDETFWGTYGTYFNDFKEDFGVEISDNGNNLYSHSISFSITSGNKATASSIATNIFANDKDTTFGISYLTGTGAIIAHTGNYRNYFSETYDLIRNTYSFTKKREVLPAFQTNYTYNLGHVISLKEDGIIDVSERGNIQGKISFLDAQGGYGELFPNSYSRCNETFLAYKDFVGGQSITNNLVNIPINSTRTFNKPSLNIDYEVSYGNNPNINSQSGVLIDETIDITKSENNIININHSYNFNSITTPLVPGLDITYGPLLVNANNSSPTKISGVYAASSLFNSFRPINRVNVSAFAGSKRKNLGISFNYTNNPIYFIVIDGITYSILDFKLSDTKPVDEINEYKVINRRTNDSVLNYAYQTEKGSKNISLTALLKRTSNNIIINPRTDISSNLLSLYKFAVSKVLESLNGTSVLSLSYYLSDVRYRFNSNNEITMDIVITYTVKKYRDI